MSVESLFFGQSIGFFLHAPSSSPLDPLATVGERLFEIDLKRFTLTGIYHFIPYWASVLSTPLSRACFLLLAIFLSFHTEQQAQYIPGTPRSRRSRAYHFEPVPAHPAPFPSSFPDESPCFPSAAGTARRRQATSKHRRAERISGFLSPRLFLLLALVLGAAFLRGTFSSYCENDPPCRRAAPARGDRPPDFAAAFFLAVLLGSTFFVFVGWQPPCARRGCRPFIQEMTIQSSFLFFFWLLSLLRAGAVPFGSALCFGRPFLLSQFRAVHFF